MSVSDTATGVPRGYWQSQPCRSFSSIELGDRGGDRAAESVQLLLEHDRDGDRGVVGRGEADEPGGVDVVHRGLGGARLAGHLDARDLGGGAGAGLHDGDHHLGQVGGGGGLDRAAEVVRPRVVDGRPVGADDPLHEIRPRHDAAVRDRRRDEEPSAAASPPGAPARTRAGPGRRPCRDASGTRACRCSRGRSARARSPASRAAASSRSRTSSRTRGSSPRRSSCPTLQKTELIECWKPCASVTRPNASGPFWSGLPAFDTFLPYSMQ